MSTPKAPRNPSDDELFDRGTITDSDSEFLAELDRVLAAETPVIPPGLPTPPPAAAVNPSPPVKPAPRAREVPSFAPPPAPIFDSNAGESSLFTLSESPKTPPAAAGEDSLFSPQAAPALTHQKAAPNWEPAAMPPAVEREPLYPPRRSRALRESLAPPDVVAAPEDYAGPASDIWERATPPQARAEPPPAVAAMPTPEVPAASAPKPATTPPPTPKPPPKPAAKTAPVKSAPAPSHNRWAGVALALGLIGLALGGAGLWQVQVANERVSQIEAQRDLATGTDPEVQTLRRELERMGGELEGLHALLPTTPPPEAASASDLAALQTELAEVKKRVETLSDAATNPGNLKPEITELRGQLGALQTAFTAQEARLVRVEHPTATPVIVRTTVNPSVETTKALVAERPKTPPKVAAAPSPPKPALAPEPAAPPPPKAKPSEWHVNLFSLRRKEKAEQELARLRADGTQGEIVATSSGGQTWYRVSVGGFADFDAAKTYADSVRGKPGFGTAWIGRR